MFEKYSAVVDGFDPILFAGRVEKVQGQLIETRGPQAVVGELCRIQLPERGETVAAEVVGLRGPTVQLMCFSDLQGIEIGSRVVATGDGLSIPVSPALLGRVLDGLGRPIDGKGEIGGGEFQSIYNSPPDVLSRRRITQQIETGVRAIDGLLPVGKGQRLGVFSGSGLGKSTLLGMIARNTRADVNVIALIGERGREVREFIENDLGPEGFARSVLVVSTSNTPPMARLKGAFTAMAVAEYFRDQGKDVMLLFDSVTRFARAQREIGLAIGETPATRGFTPSVFSTLPKLLERCGTSDRGTITGFFAILVEGDDMDEPVADSVRGILDGHLVLSRKIAQRAQYPAVDVLASISRLAVKVAPADVRKATDYLRRMLAVYTEAEDLINVGAYVRGTNPEIDEAVRLMPVLRSFLTQGVEEKAPLEETRNRILEIAAGERPEPEANGAEDEEI